VTVSNRSHSMGLVVVCGGYCLPVLRVSICFMASSLSVTSAAYLYWPLIRTPTAITLLTDMCGDFPVMWWLAREAGLLGGAACFPSFYPRWGMWTNSNTARAHVKG
jgi:hypothetical protein